MVSTGSAGQIAYYSGAGTALSGVSMVPLTAGGTGAATAAAGLASLGGVASTIAVNGHALSGNVTVSASDLTTGTLPHAELPVLVSSDVPNNAANTTGTAGNVTGTVAVENGGTGATTAALALASLGGQTALGYAPLNPANNLSDVLNAGTALADIGGVAITTTVNGHALSGNVTVSASDVTTGTLPHAQLPALVSGDVPNNAANTTGTAATITGSILSTQVTGLGTAAVQSTSAFDAAGVAATETTRAESSEGTLSSASSTETTRAEAAEAPLVPKVTTVNGHALSGNVVVSASDLTTGTMPHAQLPTLLSGDIPNNAANSTGTAGNVTGTVTIGNGGTGAATATAALGNLGGQAALGYTPLKPTNNLSDVSSAATALTNLGGLPLAGGALTGALSGTAASFSGIVTASVAYPLQIGTIYYLDSFVQQHPTGCTVSSTSYATPYDCALATIQAQITATGLGYELIGGAGTYLRCKDIAWPYSATTGATLDLEGVAAPGTPTSGGSSYNGNFPSTVIQQSSSCASTYPMVYVPGTQTPFTAPHFRNVTFDANYTSPAYGYMNNTIDAEYTNVYGIDLKGGSWTGAPTVHGAALTGGWLLGNPGSSSYNYSTVVNNLQSILLGTALFAHSPVTGGALAFGQLTVSGGTVTAAILLSTCNTNGYAPGTGSSSCTGYNYLFSPQVLVLSPQCSVAPVITPTVSGSAGTYKVTALTVTSGGTCTLVSNGTTTLSMFIADEPQAAYGIYMDIHNAAPNNVLSNFGTVAAIADESGLVGTDWHAEYSPGIIDYARTGIYIGLDMDSSVGFNFQALNVPGASPFKVTLVSPRMEYNGIPYPYGSVNYYSGAAGQAITVVDPICMTAPSNGNSNFDYFSYQGSLDGITSSTLNNPFHVIHDQDCNNTSRTAYDRGMIPLEMPIDGTDLVLGSDIAANAVSISFQQRGQVGWYGGSSGVGLGAGIAGGTAHNVLFDANATSVSGVATAGYVYSGNTGGAGGGFYFEAQSTAIVSASTIAPTFPVHHVTGTAAISTITVPTACASSGYDCNVGLIADGAWATGTSGNIAVAVTATVGYRYDFTYDPGTSKWYPKF